MPYIVANACAHLVLRSVACCAPGCVLRRSPAEDSMPTEAGGKDSSSSAKSSTSASEETPLVAKNDASEYTEKFKIMFSIGLLISIAVLKTQLTAVLFAGSKFPTAYSFYSCIVTCVLLVPVFIIKPSQWGVPVREMFVGPHYSLTLIVIFTSFDLGLTNVALSEISAALVSCIQATNPFWCIMIESLLSGKWQHGAVYLSVLCVVLGAALTSVSQIDKITALGLCSAIAAVFCSASKYVFAHAAFKEFKGVMGPLALLFWVDILMMPVYIVWVLINHEVSNLFAAHLSAGKWLQFTFTAGLGGVRALTQYVVLTFVSATSMSTANIFTQILNICISMMWQHTHTSPELFIGIIITIGFSFLYAHLKSDKNACYGVMKKPLLEYVFPKSKVGDESNLSGDPKEPLAAP